MARRHASDPRGPKAPGPIWGQIGWSRPASKEDNMPLDARLSTTHSASPGKPSCQSSQADPQVRHKEGWGLCRTITARASLRAAATQQNDCARRKSAKTQPLAVRRSALLDMMHIVWSHTGPRAPHTSAPWMGQLCAGQPPTRQAMLDFPRPPQRSQDVRRNGESSACGHLAGR